MNKISHTDTTHSDEFVESLEKSKQVFLSFAERISKVNFSLLIDHFAKKCENVFYFEQPEKSIVFLSFDELTIQTFQNKEFFRISDEIRTLKSKLISNHDEFKDIEFPVFLTCAKFPSKKLSNEWKDFGEIDFIIPKISLYKNKNDYFLLYNTLTENFSSVQNLELILEQQAEKIYSLEQKLKENQESKALILEIKQPEEENEWNRIVNNSVDMIKNKELSKIVLSRRLLFDIKSEINWQNIFNEFKNKYSNCTNFLIKSGESIFFGATPELLIKFSNHNFFTEALAGSIKRGLTPEDDQLLEKQLLESKKNIIEHDLVTNHIKTGLNTFAEKMDVDNSPVVKKFSNIQHLQTIIKGKLKSKANIFDIIHAIFPTPAVCGYPQDKSSQYIEEMENFDRGLYSGIIGWFNFYGSGEFNVAIRSALINNNKLYTYAGCGIVEDSNSQDEFEETKLKFKSILSLFDNAN